jgi:hypothetical protein
MSQHLITDEVFDLSVPSKYDAEHLPAEVIVRQTCLVNQRGALVGDIMEATPSELEEIVNPRLVGTG